MGENPDENSLVKTKGRRLIKESETRTEAYILRSPYEDRGAQETSKGEACWKTTTDNEDRVEIQEDSPRGPVCDEKEKKPDEAAAPTRVQGTSATCGEETRKFPRSAEEACQSGSMPATCGGETLNNPQLAEETCQRGKIPGMCGSEGTTTSEKDPEAGAQPLRIQIGRREGASEEVGDGQDKDNVANGARRLHENTAEGARKTIHDTTEGARKTNQKTAEGARKTIKNTAEGARKTNYNTADGARKSSQNAADGARKTNDNAADRAWRTKQDITEGARKTHQNTADGARKTNENAADQGTETTGVPAGEAVPNKMEDAINDSVPHDPRDPVKVAQIAKKRAKHNNTSKYCM
ncbi:hypothetical protein DYB28_012599 [Aphanomyces astaci]|uniref:Uncharacterized protein n=1 Tax=Aphanomyces astaci TaxID=112090 RepID=A0A9X8E009_APHAT|nr:hypothetical protein DYB28_012599 [Aphanomyces astaci]